MWNKITENPKLKTSEIVAEMRKHFKVWVYDEVNLDTNFPAPTKKTTRTFQPNVEADPECANKSYEDLERANLIKDSITLRERLLMELQYFQETGKHLDIENLTLCAGSRYPYGYVPYVLWHPDFGEVHVCWCHSGHRYSGLRSRVAVFPKSLKLCPNCKKLEAQLKKIKEIIR